MPFTNPQEFGRPITIKDEGVPIATNVGSIDFVGAGVEGIASGGDVTETIPGGSIGNMAYNEVLTGTGTTFTLAHTPNPAGSLMLTKNGQVLTVTEDYSLFGADLTLTVAKTADDLLVAKQYSY